MSATISGLFKAIDRVLDESVPDTPERQAETQRLLELLCGAYLDTDADGRSAIRAFVADRTAQNLWLMTECAHRLKERVTGPDSLPALRLALAAVSIDDCGVDYRDTCLIVGDLYQRAERAGLDPKPLFEAVAVLSTDTRTRGGCDSVAKILRGAGS